MADTDTYLLAQVTSILGVNTTQDGRLTALENKDTDLDTQIAAIEQVNTD